MKGLVRRLYLALMLMLMLPLCVVAQDGWKSSDGSAVEETPARKSRNGLGVSLLITPDLDWQQKWDTPSDITPSFNEAKDVSMGGKLAILTFVVNPKLDSRGEIKVVSHIKVTRPTGTKSIDQSNMRCLSGVLAGPPTNVRLCESVIQFTADPGDPPGVWKVEVTVRDENRAAAIPVEGSFRLVTK